MEPLDKESREKFAACAEGWIGTRFVHQGRVKGFATDCIGLVLGALDEAGIDLHLSAEIKNVLATYSRDAFMKANEMEAAAGKYFIKVEQDEMEVGDIVLIRSGRFNRHWGVIGNNNTIIHASPSMHKVVHHNVDASVARMIFAVYRLPKGKN